MTSWAQRSVSIDQVGGLSLCDEFSPLQNICPATLLRGHCEGSRVHFMKAPSKHSSLSIWQTLLSNASKIYHITLPFFSLFFIINTSKLPTAAINDSQDSHVSFMEHSSALYFSSDLFYLVSIFSCKCESLCLPLFLPNALGPCNDSCVTP